MPDSSTIAELSALLLLWLFGYALDDCRRRMLPGFDRNVAAALVLAVVIFAAKLAALPFFPGYPDDVHAWERWSATMASHGPHAIYEPPAPADYPPAYLYALWAAGAAARSLVTTVAGLRLFVETPPLIADLVLSLLIFAAIFHYWRNHALALAAMLLFALNPALLYDSVVWGQADAVLVLPIALAALLLTQSRFVLGWAIAAVAALVKPQALLVLPVFALWTMLNSGWRTWLWCAGTFLVTALVGFAPFLSGHPWYWPLSVYTFSAGRYRLASMNAFNLMAVLGGLDRPEFVSFMGVSYLALGTVLLAALYGLLAWLMWRKPRAPMVLIATFLALLGFFVLAARVHERYLYPALALLTLLVFDAPAAMAVYIVLSATLLTNLIWVKRFHQGVAALDPHSAAVMGISLLNVAAFAIASFWGAVASTPAGTLSKRWPSAVRWFFGSRKPALDEATAGSAAEGRGEAPRKVRRKSARRRH
jgi:dolichyl-phosphate-mannose-protein mannosyltransferase